MTDSISQSTPRDTLLHVADLHFWKVTCNPLHLLNKRVLGNFNVWWKRRHQFAMDRAAEFVEGLASAGPKSLLLTGDFTSTSLVEEFAMARAFVDTLRAKHFDIHAIPGNHDVYTFESVRAQRFEKYFADCHPKSGLPARVTLPGGTPLILVPTVCPNFVSSQGRITEAEVARTSELLAQADDCILVAGHYPLLDKTHGYEMTKDRRLRNAASLRNALGKSGKRILYIAGHVHRFSYVRDPDFDNLSHLCTGTFFGRNPRENIDGEFAEVRVNDADFVVIRHTHSNERWSNSTKHRVGSPDQN
ncbi:MAG: metallophosphoesterase [Candidatus Hydrogenedentes bacterium]|nr:metallophosphoesterase [Candidatus Hydrogenedentota bacterium]